ncbi:DNA adenine methylase [Hymenobacter convexus]|uniref:DNA adenine methylase n=1 Tax=Hymenobacter sp. CA1UV-4 TaxID=3063782 RepID=UPI0027295CAD|nr:DNA adenine methylase [Hymenobacter sp. CA1UV-4]
MRYPGGKLKVANYVKYLFEVNDLLDGDYAEPYAGGCSVAFSLLFGQYASRIFINDLDPAVYAFWHSVLNETEGLNRLITDATLDMTEWKRQRSIIIDPNVTMLERGFAAFYLNRANRSGIIMGGVIGGQDQSGNWKIDARFNKRELIRRIQKIARHRDVIHLSNLDASVFLAEVVPTMDVRSLTYLDPPYYVKGQGLYANAYDKDDHAAVAAQVSALDKPWLVSYDDTPKIIELYPNFRRLQYGLTYSAQERRKGGEVMFFSDGLVVPENITNPSEVSTQEILNLLNH